MGLPTTFGKVERPKLNGKGNGDGEEPPEDRPLNLKRSHESDSEDPNKDRIKLQFELMGYAFVDKTTSVDEIGSTEGEIVFRKKHVRLHNRMLKMMPSAATKPKHTFFDDDGNEMNDTIEREVDVVLHTSSDDEDIPPAPSRINIPFTSQLSSDANPSEENEEKPPPPEVVNVNLSIDQENESNCIEDPVSYGEEVKEQQSRWPTTRHSRSFGINVFRCSQCLTLAFAWIAVSSCKFLGGD